MKNHREKSRCMFCVPSMYLEVPCQVPLPGTLRVNDTLEVPMLNRWEECTFAVGLLFSFWDDPMYSIAAAARKLSCLYENLQIPRISLLNT